MPHAPSRARSVPAAAGAGLVLLLGLLGCRGGGPVARAEASVLAREIEALRGLLAAAEADTLFSYRHLTIGVREELVREILETRLPVETTLAGGLRVRLATAAVSFQGGQSLVTLKGRVGPLPGSGAFADVALLGGLDRIEVDPGSGTLSARIALDRVELQRVAGDDVEPGLLASVTAGLGGRALGALGEVVPRVDIPVRFAQVLEFAGVEEGAVTIPAARLPVRMTVVRVVSMAGRLWVALDLAAGPSEGGEARGGP